MRKKIAVFFVLFSLTFLSCTIIRPHKEVYHLTILYINDYHGHITSFKPNFKDKHKMGGMARIATIVKEIREENAKNRVPTLFLCAGDILQGTPMSTVFKGEPDFICLNKIGLDAMVLGNHEFDYGQKNLRRLIQIAHFPVLGANVVTEGDKKPFAKPFFTKKIKGLYISILGLVTTETPITTHPRNVKGLLFLDPVTTAEKILTKVRRRSLVIGLTHLGYKMDRKFAESTNRIDVIIGGHSHTKIDKPERVKNTLICQAYEYGEYVGRLDLDIETGRVLRYEGKLIPVTEDIKEDTEIKKIIDKYQAKLDKKLKEVIGITIVPLDGKREDIRNTETNLGNLVADIMRKTARADIALVNAGSIRANIAAGNIAVEDIMKVLPFGGHLVTMKLTGNEILEVLTHFASLEPGSGGFLQVSGLTIEIEKKQIKTLGINGKQLEPEKIYKVATNDFLAAGGDGYNTFKNGRDYMDTGLVISDIFTDYVKEQKEINVTTDGRIKKD